MPALIVATVRIREIAATVRAAAGVAGKSSRVMPMNVRISAQAARMMPQTWNEVTAETLPEEAAHVFGSAMPCGDPRTDARGAHAPRRNRCRIGVRTSSRRVGRAARGVRMGAAVGPAAALVTALGDGLLADCPPNDPEER